MIVRVCMSVKNCAAKNHAVYTADKSFVIVTPRYLILSTFSRTVQIFVCQLHHVAFDRLESHTPFPSPIS